MLTKRDYTAPESGCVTLVIDDGFQVFIDQDDYDRIAPYRWYVRQSRGGKYAYRKKTTRGKEFRVWMHRQITHCPNDKVVHHLNHNGLDNRKENLLVVTVPQHRQIHQSFYS